MTFLPGASNYKYNGTWDHWFGPAERDGTYNIDSVYAGEAAIALHDLGLMPTKTRAVQLRYRYYVGSMPMCRCATCCSYQSLISSYITHVINCLVLFRGSEYVCKNLLYFQESSYCTVQPQQRS